VHKKRKIITTRRKKSKFQKIKECNHVTSKVNDDALADSYSKEQVFLKTIEIK